MPEPVRRSLEAVRRHRRPPAVCDVRPTSRPRNRLSPHALALILRAWLAEADNA
jgi:hypothetical protein